MPADREPPADRISDPGLEQDALRLALGRLDEAASLAEWLEERYELHPRSSLAADDRKTNPFKSSHYIVHQLVVALETLASLRRLIVRNENDESLDIIAGPFGPYALLRNSLDCSAMAVWLLEAPSRQERITRRMRVEVEEAHRSKQARESQDVNAAAKWYAKKTGRISEICRSAGIGEASKLAKLRPTTAILEHLSGDERFQEFAPLATWQLCSGMAHGKVWATLAINDIESVSHNVAEKESVSRITISYIALGMFTHRAFGLAFKGCELLKRQATAHV